MAKTRHSAGETGARSISFHGFLVVRSMRIISGIEGLAEQVGGFLGAVGQGRRDAEQRRAGGTEEAADDQPADRSPDRLDAGGEVDVDRKPPCAR